MAKICFLFLFSLVFCSCNNDKDQDALMASNEAMESACISRDEEHEEILRSIGNIYRDRGEKPREKTIRDKAASLRDQTKNLLSSVSAIKDELIKSSGELNENGVPRADKSAMVNEEQIKNLNASLSSWNSLLGASSKNAGDSLTLYIANLNREMPLTLHLLNLNNLQWKILTLESPLMTKLMTEIDQDPVGKFKNLKVSISAFANVVEEGQEYTADISPSYISDSKTFVKEVKMNGQSFPVDSNGIGKVSFVARGDKFNKEGLCKKTWRGSITLHMPLRDTTLTITKEYFIKKTCAK